MQFEAPHPAMQDKRYHTRPSSSSSSSRDDTAVYASDQFFAPEYPRPDIKSSDSRLAASSPYTQVPRSRQASASSLPSLPPSPEHTATAYALHSMRGAHGGSVQGGLRSPMRSGKHALQMPPASDMPMSESGAPPTKKSRRASSSVGGGRVQGACVRCKRLKMKCTFADGDLSKCARCLSGGHDCIVTGRKPRSPGQSEILRKLIKEKDAQIENLLAVLNPASQSATPLSINLPRLALTPEQRTQYREVLVYLDKSQGGSARSTSGDAKHTVRLNVSELESEWEEEDEDDEGSGVDELQESTALLHIQPMPERNAPVGMMAQAALESRSSLSRMSSPASNIAPSSSDGDQQTREETSGGGIGNADYFSPGSYYSDPGIRRLIVERQAAPDILLSGLITNDDVVKLFDIYWKWINPVMSLLDENIHTPSQVLIRCPFLFTIICAIASRYYDEKPHVYTMAIHMAKSAAANAFLDGCKTVEMCQAFALMASYMPPARKWEEDRAFFFSGIAFRLAIDLDLRHVPPTMPTDERRQREVLNRLRTHIICYIIDRSFCLNLGKPFMIPEDELIRNTGTQFYGHAHSLVSDRYLVSLVELFRIMTRFAELANPAMARPVAETLDLYGTHKVFTEELSVWKDGHNKRCAVELAPDAAADDRLRMALMDSVYHHCRLVTYSVGMQHVLKQGKLMQDTLFFAGCLQTASSIINCVIDRISPTGFIRYSPEHVFGLSGYATSVLSQFIGDKYASKVDALQKQRITERLERLLEAVDPEWLSADETPTPRRSFAQFLSMIIQSWSHKKASATPPAPTLGKPARMPAPEMVLPPEPAPAPTSFEISPVETPDPQPSMPAYGPPKVHAADLASHAHYADTMMYVPEWTQPATPSVVPSGTVMLEGVPPHQLLPQSLDQGQMQMQMPSMPAQPWFTFAEPDFGAFMTDQWSMPWNPEPSRYQ